MTDASNRRQTARGISHTDQTNRQRAGSFPPVPWLQPIVRVRHTEDISVKLLDETASHNESRLKAQTYWLCAKSWERRSKEKEVENQRLQREIQKLQNGSNAAGVNEANGFRGGSLVSILSFNRSRPDLCYNSYFEGQTRTTLQLLRRLL